MKGKMKMKKFITLIAVLALMTGVCSCGNNDSDDGGKAGENASAVKADDENNNDGNDQTDEIDSNVPVTEESVRNHEATPIEDFEIWEGDDVVELRKYLGNDPIVVLPNEYNGKPCEAVDGLFSVGSDGNGSSVKGVYINDAMTQTAPTMFISNESIEVVIANNIETVSASTFTFNKNLKYVDLGDKLTDIDVSNCLSSGVRIHLPATVTDETYDNLGLFVLVDEKDKADCVIVGAEGSRAQSYAEEKGIPFEAE